MPDYSSYTDQCEYFDEPSDELKLKAQRVVAGHHSVTNSEEAIDLLMMLGIHPKQIEEEQCQRKEAEAREQRLKARDLEARLTHSLKNHTA